MWARPYPQSTWRNIRECPYWGESGHEKDTITEANYYTNLLFEKTKLAKLKDYIVSEIKTEIKTKWEIW